MLAFLAVGLIVVAAFMFLLGVACMTKRVPPRNVRRECGNTIERRPNVRRPLAATSTIVVRDGVVVSETRSFPLREPCWADDEVTKVGGAG